MSDVHAEHVLVVPTTLLNQLGYFQGFTRDVTRYLDDLLDPQHTSYRPRAEVEEDPRFKQLIPYAIFRHRDGQGNVRLFRYTRGQGQGEQRLHRKCSIGIGGHISADDRHESCPYQEGMRRELAEEVIVDTVYQQQCVGLINDDQTEVGRVHLGVVHLFDVAEPRVRPREDELLEAGFAPLESLRGERERFESWSRICLDALFAEDG